MQVRLQSDSSTPKIRTKHGALVREAEQDYRASMSKVRQAKTRLRKAQTQHSLNIKRLKEARQKTKEHREAQLERRQNHAVCSTCGRKGPARPAIYWYCQAPLEVPA